MASALAFVFDAYGTVFDVHSAAGRVAARFSSTLEAVSEDITSSPHLNRWGESHGNPAFPPAPLCHYIRQELLHEAIELCRLLEVDRMPCTRHLCQTRMWDIALEHFHDRWRRNHVVLADDQ